MAGGAAMAQATGGGLGEVAVSVDRWGVGGAIRRGDYAGLRIALTDLGTRQRELLVRIEVPDADGDRVLYQASVAGNPGIDQKFWMYVRVPYAFRSGDPWNILVHEAVEDATVEASEDPAGRGFRPGRLVARVPVSAPRVAEPYEGLLGVVGRQQHPSLSLYATALTAGGIGDDWSPLGHERLTQVMLTASEMPDRWFGLTPFESLVWLDGSPADLSPDAAAALRDWVTRGGHLVIVMPPAGQAWSGSEFADLLPRVRMVRREGVSLETYRGLLTDSATQALPRSSVVHTFEPLPEATTAEATRVLAGPDGECVVARRLIGVGAVTVIGIDINTIGLRSATLPQPERFWHRILGARGSKPTSVELDRIVQSAAGLRNRQAVWVDEDIPTIIARRGRATAGVLLGFVVFVTYWGLAGPLGYAILKKFGLHQHAWAAFAGVGLAFTGIAWGGATLLRPREVSATHLTLLDHVYGQPVQRARAWMSILLPEYGRSLVAVGAAATSDGGRGAVRDAVTPWDSRATEFGIGAAFPDATTYAIEARAPSVVSVPARSTVKQFQADWSGGPAWEMPRPAPDEGESPESARLRVTSPRRASGRLVHRMPGPLEHVAIIIVSGQRPVLAPGVNVGAAYLMSEASAFRLTAPWAPGEAIDLAQVTDVAPNVDVSVESFLADLLRNQVTPTGYRETADAVADRLIAQALFPLLAPPEPAAASFGRSIELGRRGATHGWDLGRWFTQPCVIVIGQLGASAQDGPTPIPLSVDGRDVEPKGRTVVRWVYPLPDRPPLMRGAELSSGEDAPAAELGGGS